jgi:copper(I)-binding protein
VRRPAAAATLTAGVLTGTLLLTGCGGSASGAAAGSDSGSTRLSVSDAYMPQPVSDTLAAGFLTITNNGDAADELTSVTSDVADSVTPHKTVGGAMQEVDHLTVPAHGRLVLQSGGNHLMFDGLKHKPVQGHTIPVELHFAHSGDLEVDMPVKSATYNPATGH